MPVSGLVLLCSELKEFAVFRKRRTSLRCKWYGRRDIVLEIVQSRSDFSFAAFSLLALGPYCCLTECGDLAGDSCDARPLKRESVLPRDEISRSLRGSSVPTA